MSDTDSNVVKWIKNPNTLNYAVTCTVFNLDKKPEILLVDYQEYPHIDVEKRLPGGKFQAQDLVASIELFIEHLAVSNQRNSFLEHFCGDVLGYNQEFLSAFEKADDHSRQNDLFNTFTGMLFEKFQKKCAASLTDDEFIRIIIQTQENTAIRELGEESGARKVGVIYLSSSSLNFGVHHKLGFVSTTVEAPNSYIGSPDPKIKKSDWYGVDENISEILANKHKMNFQEAIRHAIEFKINPNVDVLNKFLKAAK